MKKIQYSFNAEALETGHDVAFPWKGDYIFKRFRYEYFSGGKRKW
jgi:hypothetical protein